MKAASVLTIMPVGIVLAASAGAVFCQLTRINAHPRNLLLSAGICLLSSEAGLIPIVLNADADPATRFQSAWLGTILHLGLAAILSIVMLLVFRLDVSFVYWLLLMFWLSLIGLCAVLVRILRTPAGALSGAIGEG